MTSSFKRKSSAKQTTAEAGAKVSAVSPSTRLTSTGIPSLDDILGGGLPLSCSLLIIAPDKHSSYGDLVQKYFVAQGLSAGHRSIVVAGDAEEFVKDIMWTRKITQNVDIKPADDADEPIGQPDTNEIKIAWRYDQMKSVQTTILSSADNFCHNFDLGYRIPASDLEKLICSNHLSLISAQRLPPSEGRSVPRQVLSLLATFLQEKEAEASSSHPLIRICLPSLGSPWWGDVSVHSVLNFLHSLRSLLRQHSHACASISLAPHISAQHWGGLGWIEKIAWMSDAALSLSAFSADPSLIATFPDYHGLLQIHKLPASHTLFPPSDKLSTLRGLIISAGARGGSENNLAFKSTRKRLVFETIHLDIEGGVGERRTTAPHEIDKDLFYRSSECSIPGESEKTKSKDARPTVEVKVEDLELEKTGARKIDSCNPMMEASKQKKAKKQVAFQVDRYDF